MHFKSGGLILQNIEITRLSFHVIKFGIPPLHTLRSLIDGMTLRSLIVGGLGIVGGGYGWKKLKILIAGGWLLNCFFSSLF